MLYLQAWHLGLILQTLGESLASADPSAEEGEEVSERRAWKNAAEN